MKKFGTTVKNNVQWVGKIDDDLRKFHGGDYDVRHGSTYNAYLVREEKNVLIDTVWEPYDDEFVKNLEKTIPLDKIDYIVMNHGEKDHSGALPALMERIPDVPIYCTANAVKSLQGQYGGSEWNFVTVKTGDSLDVGNGKKLVFVEMRMLHWPDSMACYLTGDNILFSNDAFGQHYAATELFNDLSDEKEVFAECMTYYANILSPFSAMVKKKLAEIAAMNLTIDMIAPSHGVVWRKDPLRIVDLYAKWCDAYAEDKISIVYDSMWEGTEKLAKDLAVKLKKNSPMTDVVLCHLQKMDKNEIMTHVFSSKAIAVGCPTVVNDVMSSMGEFLHYLKELKFKGKKGAAFGCYGWSGESTAKIREGLAAAGFQTLEEEVRCNWNPNEEDFAALETVAKALTS